MVYMEESNIKPKEQNMYNDSTDTRIFPTLSTLGLKGKLQEIDKLIVLISDLPGDEFAYLDAMALTGILFEVKSAVKARIKENEAE